MRRQEFNITDKAIINPIFQEVEYGVLALCSENGIPYSVPLNFVEYNGIIYFHGAKIGRKMELIHNNPKVSFSIVDAYSVLPSYFSSKDGTACPATQFFKSITIEGKIELLTDFEEKTEALSRLMQKLQAEGNYKPMTEEIYRKSIHATTLFKLIPDKISAKFKFGQQLTDEKFRMIIDHLKKRGNAKDVKTIQLMKLLYQS